MLLVPPRSRGFAGGRTVAGGEVQRIRNVSNELACYLQPPSGDTGTYTKDLPLFYVRAAMKQIAAGVARSGYQSDDGKTPLRHSYQQTNSVSALATRERSKDMLRHILNE